MLLTILVIFTTILATTIHMIEASTTSTTTSSSFSQNPFNKERTGVSGFGARSIEKTIFPPQSSQASLPSSLKSLRGDDDDEVIESDDDKGDEEAARSKANWRDIGEGLLSVDFSQQNNNNIASPFELNDVTTEQDQDETDDSVDFLMTSSERKELWVQRSDEDPSILWVRVGSDNKLTIRLSVSAETGDWQVDRQTPPRDFLKRYPMETWVPIEGFYGLYRMPSGILWVLVSKTEPVYSAPPLKDSPLSSSWLNIHRVVNLEIVHLSRPNINERSLPPMQLREEIRQLKLLRKALKKHDFYYIAKTSDGEALDSPISMQDMTKTLQRSILQGDKAKESTAWWRTEGLDDEDDTNGRPDPRFFWNQYAVEPLLQRYRSSAQKRSLLDVMLQNVVPVTSAYVGVQQNIQINTGTKKRSQLLSYDELLISRRSRFRAGTRFTVRGADATGAVANFVETEQLCLMISENMKGDRLVENVASHVQIRGSIPLRWSSPADVKTYRPRVRIGTDPVAQARALRSHLVEQLSLYAPEGVSGRSADIANIVFVNLVDKKSDQGRLGKAFDSVLQAVMDVYSKPGDAISATSIPLPSNAVQHVWYDFHAEVKQGRWDRLGMLLDEVQPSLDSHSFFSAEASTEGRGGGWSVASLQNAVVRTNCMDCLDRTNVVQSIFGRYMLFQQLSAILDKENKKKKSWIPLKDAFVANRLTLPWENGERAHRLLWADNADAISRLYAGTPALKGDFTRTGKRTKMGALDDGMNSLQRYYLNNFLDSDRQEGCDLMVGYVTFSNTGDMPMEFDDFVEDNVDDDDSNSTTTTNGSSKSGSELSLRQPILASARDAMLKDVVNSATFQNREDVRDRLRDVGVGSDIDREVLEEALDLRWLPGDLQTHLRSQAGGDTASSNPRTDPQQSNTENDKVKVRPATSSGGFQTQVALKAIDDRSKEIVPWWVELPENWLAGTEEDKEEDIQGEYADLVESILNLWQRINIFTMILIMTLSIQSPNAVAYVSLALLSFVYLPTCLKEDWQQRSSRLEDILARLPKQLRRRRGGARNFNEGSDEENGEEDEC